MTNPGPQKLQPTPTGARLHYLRQVERHAPYDQRHGVTANHCLRLGWVESVCRTSRGDIVRVLDIPIDDWVLGDYTLAGTRLTTAGREFLDKHMPNRNGR